MKDSTEKVRNTCKHKPRGKPFASVDPRRKPGGGRPPAPKCIPDLLRWAGNMKAPDKVVEEMRKVFGVQGDLTVEQATILVVRMMALQGEMKAIEFIADRTEGKALQSIDMNASDGPLFVVLPPSVKREPPTNAADTHTETV